MAKDTKRSRDSKWSHEETLVLAKLERASVFPNEVEGQIVWKKIARKISSRFRDKLASMKLDTAYGEEWYTIEKQVRKRKESGGICDLIAGKVSKGSKPAGSHSDLLPEHIPGVRDTLHMTPPASTSESVTASLDAHHEQSTGANEQVLTRPSLEVENLSPEEETQQDQEPLQDVVSEWEWADARVETAKIEQVETGSELIVPWDLSHESPSHDQQCGTRNGAAGTGHDLEDIFSCLPPLSSPEYYLAMHMSTLSLSTITAISGRQDSTVSNRTIARQSNGCNKLIRGLDMNSDLKSVSEKEQQSQQCTLKVTRQVIELQVTLCCEGCMHKVKRKLEKMEGVEKPVLFDMHIMKVSVTTTAKPEAVLEQVQTVKKNAIMWPQKK